jgi:uroporphyrinogen decarboxylase
MTESPFRKRVFNTLAFKESDICPYYIWIDEAMIKPIADYYGNEHFQHTIIQNHTVMAEIEASQKPLGNDLYIDEFGVTLLEGSIPHVEKSPLGEPSLQGYHFPDLSTPEHFDHLDPWLDANEDRFKIVQMKQFFSERLWSLRGFEEIFMDFYLNRSFAEELLDRLMENCLQAVDVLIERFGDKIDAIGMTEDTGSERSLLMDPNMWRELIKPRLRKIYSRIKNAEKSTYLHSCGHIEPIVPDLIEIGVDILQPIQPESNDIFTLKREFGRDICFAGGISTQKTLPFGSPKDVMDEVNRCLDVMAKGGGYIMAPAKPILPGVPIENAVALINRFVKQQ